MFRLIILGFLFSTALGAEERRTTTGGEFRDPFSDLEEVVDDWDEPVVVEEEPPIESEPPEIEELRREEPPARTAPRIPRTPTVDEYYDGDQERPGVEPAPEVQPGLRFPEQEPIRGPISQDIFRRQALMEASPVGSWNLSFRGGIARGLKDRPGQAHGELEFGYRIWKGLELNGVLHYRFLQDRVLSILFVPTYSFVLWRGVSTRIDLRAGLGTGWSLRGEEGNDFQYGHLPLRTHLAGLFYITNRISLLLATDTESFLLEGPTGEGLSGKFQSQALFSAGIRFEF